MLQLRGQLLLQAAAGKAVEAFGRRREVAVPAADPVNGALWSPEAADFYSQSGTAKCKSTSAELATFQAQEAQKWGKVIQAAGIKPD